MSAATAELLLKISSDVAGLRTAISETKNAENGLINYGKAGAGIAAGFESMRLGLRGISEAFKQTVVEGVNFNKMIETSQIGIAGSLRNFFPERYKTFSDALKGSGEVIDALKKKSMEFGLSFESVADQYRANIGAMMKGGIYDLQSRSI
jgi:hypothetical protein